jgi:hypothetical protein
VRAAVLAVAVQSALLLAGIGPADIVQAVAGVPW